ncbi:MAG: hypothetical protein AAGJ11_15075 [Bacteroidota bacterium]
MPSLHTPALSLVPPPASQATSAAKGPSAWLDLQKRVPRRNQTVRVLTRRGTDHAAQFVVVHTRDWPSGASWSVETTGAALPFTEVVAWCEDPAARPTRQVAAQSAGVTLPARPRPAILDEVLIELERTAGVLRLLPEEPLDWSPHPDIPNLRVLSERLVRIVMRMGWILELDHLELLYEPRLPSLRTPREIIETYEANAGTVRTMADRLGGEDLRALWLLSQSGAQVSRIPRGNALRLYGLTPLVCHRSEVGLLLRAMGIATPHPYPQWTFEDAPIPLWSFADTPPQRETVPAPTAEGVLADTLAASLRMHQAARAGTPSDLAGHRLAA